MTAPNHDAASVRALRRPWWLRVKFQWLPVFANAALYVGPFTVSWDHEFTPYTPGVGFGWLPQPRRTVRLWLDLAFGGKPFRMLAQIKLWRDDRYCECGVLRECCDDERRHALRIDRKRLA